MAETLKTVISLRLRRGRATCGRSVQLAAFNFQAIAVRRSIRLLQVRQSMVPAGSLAVEGIWLRWNCRGRRGRVRTSESSVAVTRASCRCRRPNICSCWTGRLGSSVPASEEQRRSSSLRSLSDWGLRLKCGVDWSRILDACLAWWPVSRSGLMNIVRKRIHIGIGLGKIREN